MHKQCVHKHWWIINLELNDDKCKWVGVVGGWGVGWQVGVGWWVGANPDLNPSPDLNYNPV